MSPNSGCGLANGKSGADLIYLRWDKQIQKCVDWKWEAGGAVSESQVDRISLLAGISGRFAHRSVEPEEYTRISRSEKGNCEFSFQHIQPR